MNNSIAVDPHEHTYIRPERLRLGALIAAAGLVGFGLILFLAANWDEFSRFQKFGLTGAVIAVGGLGALATASLRVPGLLLAFAGTGGMLALIGQTYQTGADTWQLFAVWAALTLPWAVAARSDAVWTPWVAVVMTAAALWYHTFGTFDSAWFADITQTQQTPRLLGIPHPMLGVWIFSLGICVLMGPQAQLDSWLGVRHWAFRLALVLTMSLIAAHAIEAVIASRTRLTIYFTGLGILAGIAAWLAMAARRDLLLVSATALALDAVLICGIVRLVLPTMRRADFGSFFLIGLIAAAIVAASVVAIMRLVRRDANISASTSEPMARVSARDVDAVRPWPVVLLSGFGALMAAVPLIVGLGVMLGSTLQRGPGTYIVAFIVLAIAFYNIVRAKGLFAEQLAFVGAAVGLLLLGWGLFRDLPLGAAGFFCGVISLALALSLGRAWLGALLGAAATVGFVLALQTLLPGRWYQHGIGAYGIIWSLVAFAGVGAAYLLRQQQGWMRPLSQRHVDEDIVDATTAGWLAAALVGLAIGSGTTFLIGSRLGGFTGLASIESAQYLSSWARALSVPAALIGCGWLWHEMPSARKPLAMTIMAIAVALSFVMPALGATLLVLACAIITQRRVIAITAVAAILWIIGAFYYSLLLPLTTKAAILTGAGALLGIAASIAGTQLPEARSVQVGSASPATLGRALTLVGLLIAGDISAEAIRAKEALIRDGQPVFVELIPVDPRSLMQGDYMALRFQLPNGALRHQPRGGERPRAIGMRDANGVLRLTRIGDGRTPLAVGEMMIELQRKGGRWIVVTDAWFFKEGTARRWEAARYGEFRVLSDGRALLVGLADKDRVAIK